MPTGISENQQVFRRCRICVHSRVTCLTSAFFIKDATNQSTRSGHFRSFSNTLLFGAVLTFAVGEGDERSLLTEGSKEDLNRRKQRKRRGTRIRFSGWSLDEFLFAA